eukprot:TRINITY_DN13028_c0_g1_i1.p1 TRINITY_DN13028_c0_g1~~TRINITY_DN13028_c0_g1_i1.p1  ORF type:complete len:187 (-),score=24.68 TRINITY_DN13028_c0_g1_i1:101-661(-)
MTAAGSLTTVTISQDYGWVLFVACLIAFQCWFQGFMAGAQRRKYFTAKFFKQHFPNLKPAPEGGYPDMGSGLFAQKLPLQDWIKFNNHQRSHYNYIEGIATILVFLLVGGLFYPNLSAALGAVYVLGRLIYGIGYAISGSRGRMAGVALVDISLVVLFGLSVYGAFQFAGGSQALTAKLTNLLAGK